MDELVAWLRSVFDDIERSARLPRWDGYSDRYIDHPEEFERDREAFNATWHTADCGYHMLEMNSECRCDVPAQVLCDIAAKRRVIDAYRDAASRADYYARDGEEPFASEARGYAEALAKAVRLAALSYADRDGWRPEWAPEVQVMGG